jgi:hypothetical protein
LIGRGATSKVFKVSKGKEIKAIKAILAEDLESNTSLVGGEIMIGVNISFIIMELFHKEITNI